MVIKFKVPENIAANYLISNIALPPANSEQLDTNYIFLKVRFNPS